MIQKHLVGACVSLGAARHKQNLQPRPRVVEVKGWRTGQSRSLVDKQGEPVSVDQEALATEERKLRRLRRAMDLTAALLWRVDLTLEEAQDVVGHAKHTALQLFPDKEETFDLIYGSRFRRILVEKYRLQ
jgi:hypothetical protein